MNCIIGQKLSIVTRKPQTTRHRVVGVLTEPDYQVIFLDTPGIIDPRYGLHRSMMKAVSAATAEADLVLFVIAATDSAPDLQSLKRVSNDVPALLVVTKSDLTTPLSALPLVEQYLEIRPFEAVVPVSGKTGFQVDRLLTEIEKRLPAGPRYYPDDMVSEHPERFFVTEIVREKILELYSQEIPYAVQVNVAEYQAGSANKKTRILLDIVVERESQKAVIIGKGGAALKKVGIRARKDIEAFLGEDVYLQLFVKVRSGWRNTDNMLRDYGYDT